MLSRRKFLSLTGAAAFGVAVLALPGCGESRGAASSASAPASSTSAAAGSAASTSQAVAQSSSTEAAQSSAASAAGALILYYSRAGENYQVGVIEEGNTAIIAKMIAEETGAELFEIVPAEAYPEGYDACCDVALEEQKSGARPAYADDIDIAPYKTIYLGYPIWWEDLPMTVYTFLEAHDWSGKEIRPFCTHGGSGLSKTVDAIKETCAGATVSAGLSIAGTTAQNSHEEARAAVTDWLG